jgi:RHS repeat-associated protein
MRVVNADGSFATMPVLDYQAYGEPRTLHGDSLVPARPKFTGKELDTDLNLYYFGARWYDPELAAWISPDPANENHNAYGYVDGNPVAYLDPYGLWKVGLGLSVGYTKSGGFSMGLGVGIEDVKLPGLDINTYFGADRNFGDDSYSYSAQVGLTPCVGVCLGGGIGGSYNTRGGFAANAYGSAGVGFLGVGDAGVRIGTHQYWDKNFSYVGGDVYGELNGNAYGNGGAIGYSHGFGAVQSG